MSGGWGVAFLLLGEGFMPSFGCSEAIIAFCLPRCELYYHLCKLDKECASEMSKSKMSFLFYFKRASHIVLNMKYLMVSSQ